LISVNRKIIPIQRIATNTGKWYDTGDRYEHKKTVPIQGISTNIGKQYSLETRIIIGFKLFTTIKERITVDL